MTDMARVFVAAAAAVLLLLAVVVRGAAADPLSEAEKFKGMTWAQLDCSHMVHRAFTNAGMPYTYANTPMWPPRGFVKVNGTPQRNDVVLFQGHVGIVKSAAPGGASGEFFGSQTSTGPAYTLWGPGKYWGGTTKLLGFYRYSLRDL